MSVDLSKIKPGDEVTVRAVVLRNTAKIGVQGQWFMCWPDHHDATFYAFPKDIVSHTPKALAVGDRVKRRDANNPYAAKIIAIDRTGEWAVLQRTDKNEQPWIYALSLLEVDQ